jgi:hypothetical protein
LGTIYSKEFGPYAIILCILCFVMEVAVVWI